MEPDSKQARELKHQLRRAVLLQGRTWSEELDLLVGGCAVAALALRAAWVFLRDMDYGPADQPRPTDAAALDAFANVECMEKSLADWSSRLPLSDEDKLILLDLPDTPRGAQLAIGRALTGKPAASGC